MYYFLIYIIFSAIFIQSCKSTDCDTKPENKLDAYSMSELKKEESKPIPGELNFIIMVKENISDSVIKNLEDENIKIVAVTERFITANAKPESIRKILEFDFVKSVEVNKTKFSH